MTNTTKWLENNPSVPYIPELHSNNFVDGNNVLYVEQTEYSNIMLLPITGITRLYI